MAILKSRVAMCRKCKATFTVNNPQGARLVAVECPSCGTSLRIPFETDETIMPTSNSKSSSCYLTHNGNRFNLHEGKNTIGRENSQHNATIEIATNDMSMSREHCRIDVVRLQSGRIKAVISDIRGADRIQKLATRVTGDPLDPEDKIVLNNGDIIKMGEQKIRFNQE